MVIYNECHARALEELLKEVCNYTDQECAQVCGCQEHMENTRSSQEEYESADSE